VLAGELSKAEQFLVLEVVAHEMGLHIEEDNWPASSRPRQHHFGIMLLAASTWRPGRNLVHGEEAAAMPQHVR